MDLATLKAEVSRIKSTLTAHDKGCQLCPLGEAHRCPVGYHLDRALKVAEQRTFDLADKEYVAGNRSPRKSRSRK